MRFVNLEDFTLKDFKQWCWDKYEFGGWTRDVELICATLLAEMLKVPFFRRKRVWEDIKYKIFAKDTIFDILEAEEINDLLWAGKIKNEEKR